VARTAAFAGRRNPRPDGTACHGPVRDRLVSACTALVASIVGPLVTLTVAKRQINANLVSSNRQKWIETLRDMLAELISLLVAVVVVKSGFKGDWNDGLAAIEADRSLLDKLERIVLVQWKIRLLINPNETDHQELYRAIETAFAHAKSRQSQEAEISADIESITRLAHGILKREWERVKRGD
jgi:hypothetical protein